MQSKFSEMPMWTIIVILGTLIFGSLLILGLYVREQLYVISGATVLSSFIAFASLVVVNKNIQGAMWKRDIAIKKVEEVYLPLHNKITELKMYINRYKNLNLQICTDSNDVNKNTFYYVNFLNYLKEKPYFYFVIENDKQLKKLLLNVTSAIGKYNDAVNKENTSREKLKTIAVINDHKFSAIREIFILTGYLDIKINEPWKE